MITSLIRIYHGALCTIDEKGNSYRIVKMEYDFLMKHGLPIPRLHWLERMKMGFSK